MSGYTDFYAVMDVLPYPLHGSVAYVQNYNPGPAWHV